MKAPAFQFYPGDWMKDPCLRGVSSASRGLWIDLICLMWESARRGFLVFPTGMVITPEQLARMTGNPPQETAGMLKELENCGVCSRTEEGIIYCRRMARDERRREILTANGQKGGRPCAVRPEAEPNANPDPDPEEDHGVNQRPNQTANQDHNQGPNQTPNQKDNQKGGSSASASSSSTEDEERERSARADFPTAEEVTAHGQALLPPADENFCLAWFEEMAGSGWVDRQHRRVHPDQWKHKFSAAWRAVQHTQREKAARSLRPALIDRFAVEKVLHQRKSKYGF